MKKRIILPLTLMLFFHNLPIETADAMTHPPATAGARAKRKAVESPPQSRGE